MPRSPLHYLRIVLELRRTFPHEHSTRHGPGAAGAGPASPRPTLALGRCQKNKRSRVELYRDDLSSSNIQPPPSPRPISPTTPYCFISRAIPSSPSTFIHSKPCPLLSTAPSPIFSLRYTRAPNNIPLPQTPALVPFPFSPQGESIDASFPHIGLLVPCKHKKLLSHHYIWTVSKLGTFLR